MPEKLIAISVNTAWNLLNFRRSLMLRLVAAGYRMVAIAPPDGYEERLKEIGVEFIPISIDRRGLSPGRDLATLLSYFRILRSLRPAAFLGYTIKPNIWGSLAAHMNGVPVINNIAGLGKTFSGGGPINQLVRTLYYVALHRSATVFFQNPDDRSLFEHAGIVKKCQTRLLPGSGVDLSHFVPPSRSAPSPGDPFRFLLVGRLLHAKGICDYVDAGRLLRASAPHARLQLLGIAQEGPDAIERARLERWVAEGAVELLSPTDDVRPYVAQADCVVLPTFYPEGTPRTLLEAAASGRPLIATDVPGCREIVIHGVNGFLVPPRDPAALAERMTQMLRQPQEALAAMGRASRAKAESQFDENLVIEAYLDAVSAAASRSTAS